MRSYFTLGEFWVHLLYWLGQFPVPWKFDEHFWFGPVDGKLRACLLCDRRIDVDVLDKLEDELLGDDNDREEETEV